MFDCLGMLTTPHTHKHRLVPSVTHHPLLPCPASVLLDLQSRLQSSTHPLRSDHVGEKACQIAKLDV